MSLHNITGIPANGLLFPHPNVLLVFDSIEKVIHCKPWKFHQ